VRDGFAIALLAAGLAVILASCVGMAALTDPLDRLHLVTPASTLGVGAVCAAVVVHEGLDASGVSAILLAVAVATANPLISHATARSIEVRRRAEQGNVPPDSGAAE
jgi:multicomponent Na+:H+ antiporter subunit G